MTFDGLKLSNQSQDVRQSLWYFSDEEGLPFTKL